MLTKDTLRPLLKHDPFRSALAFIRDWLFILTIIYLNIHYSSVWLYVPSVWVIGVFQFALGESMLHEAAHHNLFKSKLYNYGFEFVYALPFFKTVKQYKSEHQKHHNYLGNANDDLFNDYKRFGLYKPNANYFWLLIVKPITGFAGLYYASQISFKPFKKDGYKIVTFWVIALALLQLAGLIYVVFLYWFIPWFWCFHCYLYWSEIGDHLYAKAGTRSNVNRLTNFITHNNGYHYLHHKYPTIPWFNLPAAYKNDAAKLGDVSIGWLSTYRQILEGSTVRNP